MPSRHRRRVGYHRTVSNIDVLIICALKDELDALLEVRAGVVNGWSRHDGDPEFWTATLRGATGPLSIAAARATAMGGIVAAELATNLTKQLEPRCLAMCGVCAGHPDDTDLGDVIIADRVFQHDNGKLTKDGFASDLTTHMPDDRWARAAQNLAGAAGGLHGYGEPNDDAAKWWFLERLYAGRTPRKSGFQRYFSAERQAVLLEGLLGDGLVRLKGESFSLTKNGRNFTARRRTIHGASAVEVPYHIHVGPIGSGNYVVGSSSDWDRIAGQGMRKVMGLEMEAAAIGAVAYRHRKRFVVAKGVMDHGDEHKTDRFKAFAARASAEVLCAFLRRVVPEASTDPLLEQSKNHAQPTMATDERRSYLSRLHAAAARRQPLRGLLRDVGPTAELMMPQIELPVLVQTELPRSTIVDVHATPPARELLSEILTHRIQRGNRPVLRVTGGIGSGKSTLLEQTCATLALWAHDDIDAPLPQLISAEDLPRPLDQMMGRYSEVLRPGRPRARWIYLVDGYDELDATTTRPAVDAELDRLRGEADTAAIVVASRPEAAPLGFALCDHYCIIGWGPLEIEQFSRRWYAATASTSAPLPEQDHSLFRKPLTATLWLAYAAPNDDGSVSRAGLFATMVEGFFQRWVSTRSTKSHHTWLELAPVFEELAFNLLRTGGASFSQSEISRTLERCVPRATLPMLDLISKELGLLQRRPNGSYEFSLRPLAEHLAGAHLTGMTVPDVAAVASTSWSAEPVRHAIGLHSLRGRSEDSLACLRYLCEPPRSELDALDAIRRVSTAVNAVVDLRETALPIASCLADGLVAQLFDGSSNWRPQLAATILRELLDEADPRVASVVRARIEQFLQDGTDARVLTYVPLELRDFYHRDDVVRLAATRRVVSEPNIHEHRKRLFTMLQDHGRHLVSAESIAVTAALGLRAARRDEHFVAEVLPGLHALLRSGAQLYAGAAACALRPDEADPVTLAAALRYLSDGYFIPAEIWQDLKLARGGREAIEAHPPSTNRLAGPPGWTTARTELEAEVARTTVSSYTRSLAQRALGAGSLHDFTQVITQARGGASTELEILCEHATRDPAPLIALFAQVRSQLEPPRLEDVQELTFLQFTAACETSLARAISRDRRVLDAFIDMWKRARGRGPTFGQFPGAVLEPYVDEDVGVASVYAEWLRAAFGGLRAAEPNVPPRFVTIPCVREAIEELVSSVVNQAFDGHIREGEPRSYLSPSVLGRVLEQIRPFWLDEDVASRLRLWLRGDHPLQVAAALRAFGPRDIPASERAVVLEWIRRDIEPTTDSIDHVSLQISATMFCAEADLIGEVRERLFELGRSQLPVRFAAGASLALVGPNDEDVQLLSTELSTTWPDRNWSFWYGRRGEVLPALIAAAPSAWAQVRWLDVETGRIILTHLPHQFRRDLVRKIGIPALRRSLPWYRTDQMHMVRTSDDALGLAHDFGFCANDFDLG